MKTPLYKEFQKLAYALSDNNFRSAEALLRDLYKMGLPPEAQTLFDVLNNKFSQSKGEKIEFEALHYLLVHLD